MVNSTIQITCMRYNKKIGICSLKYDYFTNSTHHTAQYTL